MRIARAIGLLLVLAGCASDQQPSVGGQYTSVEATPGQWRMTYQGVRAESWDSMQATWLYRAAVFTLQKGFDGFIVIGRVRRSAAPDDDPLLHRTAVPDILTPRTRAPGRSVSGTISLAKKPFAPPPPHTFDAIEVKRELEQSISDD